jgi:hypothetical protein
MWRTPWLAVGTGLLLVIGTRAADTYTIRIKQPAQGDTFRADNTEHSQTESKVLDAKDKTLVEKAEKSTRTAAFTETVLERPEGNHRPTRLKRHYEKAQVTAEDQTEELPYQGKTVVIEKKDGRYHFTVEGGDELTGKDARVLDNEFNRGSDFDPQQALLPDKAVAVGQEWKPDLEKIAAEFGKSMSMRFDADKTEGSGKLVRVYEKDGARYGTLKFHLVLPIQQIGDGDKKIVTQAGSSWTLDVTLDDCIDGSRLDGTQKVSFAFKATGPLPLGNGQEGKVSVRGDGGAEETERETKK